MKAFVLLSVFLFGITSANAQTVVPVGAGSTNKTIQAAYDAIKAAAVSTPISSAYVLELQSDYDLDGAKLETFPITLNAIDGASATNTITIRPAAGVSKTLTCTTSSSAPITSITTSAAANTTTKFMTSSTQLLKDMKLTGYGINIGSANNTTVSDITDGVVTLATTFSWNASFNGAYSTMIACPATGTIYKATLPTNINSTTLDFPNANIPAGVVAGMIVGGNAIQTGTTIVSVAPSSVANKTRVVISKPLVTGNQTTPTLYCTDAATGIYVTPTGFQLPVSGIDGLTVGMNVAGSLVGVGSKVVKIVGTTDVYTTLSGTFTATTALIFSTPGALNPAIKFDGAKYVTIDGQSGGVGGIKNLTLSNTLTSVNATTVCFVNDASYNTIKYCNVLGSSTSVTSAPATGTIFIGTTTGTTARAGSAPSFTGSGNLYNTVDNCTIADVAGVFPSVGVYMVGTATYTNEGNAITNCNIENFFNPGAFISSGVYNDVNTNTTTITGNKFYQTTTKTYTGAGLHYPIYLNSGGVLTAITNNVIGYNSSNGTGTYTIDGNFAHRFAGIYINNYLGGNATPVAGNTITDINYTSASAGSGAEGVIVGIFQKTGNGIGASTLSTALTPNTISNITLNYSVATTASFGLAGASYSYYSGAHNFSYCNIHDLKAIPSTNTIAGKVMGIYTENSSGGNLKLNTIYNLSCGTPIVSPATTPSNTVAHIVTGIRSGSASTQAVERNSVYGLNAISTGNPVITGITNTVGTYQTTIKNNIVRLGSDVTSDAIINGLTYSMGNVNYNVFNYHNTIYISGIATKAGGPSNITYAMNFGGDNATTSNSNIRNNIFANQRTNSETGGAAKHTAFRFAFTKADVLKVLDYNLYWATPLGRYEGVGGPINYDDLAAWKGTTPNDKFFFTNDVNSIEGDPGFFSSTDLRIALTSTKVDAVGAAAGVTDDFYGSVRADLTPNDIGAVAYASTTTGPTTTIASTAGANTKTSPIPVTIKFSNSVTGFDASKITVTNCTLGTVSGTGSSYSVNVTPSGQGVVTVDVAAGVATDIAGNSNAAGTFSITYDNVAPTVTITSPSATTTNAVIPVTITFTEAVTGFDVTKLTLVNGNPSNFVAEVGGTVYTVDITAGGIGDVTVDIAAGVALDAATNGNTVASQLKVAYGTSGLVNANSNFTVYAANQSIVINASAGQTANIYSLGGQLVKSLTLNSNRVTVPSAAGFYVVKVGTQNTKVLVK